MPKLEVIKRPRSRSASVTVSNRVLRLDAALEKTGLRKFMFEERRKTDPAFPKAIPLGKRAVGWLETELDEYIVHMAKERRA